jgi:hypothetical protein
MRNLKFPLVTDSIRFLLVELFIALVSLPFIFTVIIITLSRIPSHQLVAPKVVVIVGSAL